MADSKITALTALTAADPVNDMFPVVDVSDTSMAASGTTKKISVNNILGASGTATLASATITGAATVGTTLGVTGVSTFAAGTALLPALTTTGDTNTGIYYPAADTFAVTTGGTERYRVDSTGLGIGATPAERLTIGSTTAANYIKLTNSGAATGLLIGSFNTAVDIKNREVGAINLFTSDTQRMVISATGDVTISTGNVVMGTSGKGIDFSATSHPAGMTSELLADYEEGTWTPVVTSTAGTLTSVTGQAGTYTKIGRMVTVTGIFIITTNGTGSAGLSVAGLPFTNGALSNTGAGRVDGTTGNMTQVKINAATATALISKYDNTYPAADGAYFPFTISYYV